MTTDSGATAWVMASTALVMLMTPGLAFFYGGMVRSRNVLAMLTQTVAALAAVSLAWMVLGFSLAFSGTNPVIGDLGMVGLTDPSATVPAMTEGGAAVPLPVFAAFQLMFAAVTVAMLTGATAERIRLAGLLPFAVLWTLLVYAPVAHWVFAPDGWASRLGALDFAGGTVVHVNAGAAALALVLVVGRRQGWPREISRPHNVPMVVLGAALLWFGWLGFNGGSAMSAGGIAGLAILNTQVAAATGLLAWSLVEHLRYGRATTVGAVSGAICGLVAATPGAGYLTPLRTSLIALTAGVLCAFLTGMKTWLRLDDSLDVVAVHLGGGIVGCLGLGLLGTTAVNPDGSDGLLSAGGYRQLGLQVLVVLVVAVFSFLVTLILALFLDRIVGLRAGERAERAGLDLSLHGEVGYDLAPSSPLPAAAAVNRDGTSKPSGSVRSDDPPPIWPGNGRTGSMDERTVPVQTPFRSARHGEGRTPW